MTDLFDLHLHTNASDGALSPEDVVRAAARLGLKAIAITDHDSTAGVESAQAEGRRLGLPVISGAEFSAAFDGELHILGYGLDLHSSAYLDFQAGQQRRREERNGHMLEKLRSLGVYLPAQHLPASAPGVYGRVHMARGMVAAGYVSSMDEAFRRYLGYGRSAYVARRRFESAEIIASIMQSGGQAVLAHPGRMGLQQSDMAALVVRLRGQGLAGIEAFYPTHTDDDVAFYTRLAADAALVCTYGSDCHWRSGEMAAQAFGRFPIASATYAWLDTLVRGCGT